MGNASGIHPPPLPIPAMVMPAISCVIPTRAAIIERPSVTLVMISIVSSERRSVRPISRPTAGISPADRPTIALDRTDRLSSSGKLGSLIKRSAMGKLQPKKITKDFSFSNMGRILARLFPYFNLLSFSDSNFLMIMDTGISDLAEWFCSFL